jgi:hypothetical protein
METARTRVDRGILEGLVEALSNKNSQFDIALRDLTINLPNLRMSAELNGKVTVTMTTRDLTDEEKAALAKKNIELTA